MLIWLFDRFRKVIFSKLRCVSVYHDLILAYMWEWWHYLSPLPHIIASTLPWELALKSWHEAAVSLPWQVSCWCIGKGGGGGGWFSWLKAVLWAFHQCSDVDGLMDGNRMGIQPEKLSCNYPEDVSWAGIQSILTQLQEVMPVVQKVSVCIIMYSNSSCRVSLVAVITLDIGHSDLHCHVLPSSYI